MLFSEILGRRGVAVSPASHFGAVVNPLGSASINSVITEVVTGSSLSHSSTRTLTFEVLPVKLNPYPLML